MVQSVTTVFVGVVLVILSGSLVAHLLRRASSAASSSPTGAADPFSLLRDCSRQEDAKLNDQTKIWKTLKHGWNARAKAIGRRIGGAKFVLDLGAGAQGMKRFVAPGAVYVPADAFPRSSTDLVCDFNEHEYPLSLVGKVDLVVAQGIYEYIWDKWLFLKVLRRFNCRVIITAHFSYLASNKLWFTPLTKQTFLKWVARAGFTVSESFAEGPDREDVTFVLL